MKILTQQKFILALPVFAMFFIASCKNDPPAAPQNSETISGFLHDEQGYIVPNAIVEAVNLSKVVIARDTSDEAGYFSLSNLPANHSELKLEARHTDFKDFEVLLSSLTNGQINPSISVPMIHDDSACGRLYLTVRDVVTLAALEGAEVRLRRNGVLVTTTLTDNTGHVEFNYLMAGTYSLRIAKQGYQVVERNATVQYCDSSSMDIRMEQFSGGGDTCCHGSLRILLKDVNGNNVIGVSVKLTRSGMENRVKTSTADGVAFEELCLGEYGVRVSKDGFKVLEFGIVMGCNEDKVITKTLESESVDSCCHGLATITVRDSASGNPLQNATLKLWKGSTIKEIVTTNANGVATVDGLCEGTYQFSVIREGYKGQEFNFTMGCNNQYSRTVYLVEKTVEPCCTAILKVRTIDSVSQAWINGVTVTITQNGNQIATGVTGPEGWYGKEGLCAPATYTVTFSMTGYVTKSFDFYFNECKKIQETIQLAP